MDLKTVRPEEIRPSNTLQPRSELHPYMDKVVYQIYPRSFQDSNGDGIGDLPGIISRLDYLQDLGVDQIWLSPIYPSPNCDNGYDVSDYRAIAPEFGTMADFEELVKEAKKRGIGIMMDMVFNHTSDEHEWFQKALQNDPVYKDYYIFKDPREGKEPTNWKSKFGGSAWQYVKELDQYYLHVFDIRQPDLNWENPAVRKECADVINFWREKGVEGFRFDVVNLISKSGYEDDFDWDGRRFYTDGPKIHEFLQELNSSSFGEDPQILTVGEMNSTTLENCTRYASLKRDELDMVFSFHHLKADYALLGKNKEKWVLKSPDLQEFRRILFEWQSGMQKNGSWNAMFLNCHDQPRSLSRFGDEGKYRDESAKTLGTMIHMLRGTPYIYQGEELAAKNPGFTSLSQYRDVESLNAWTIMEERGIDEEERIKILAQKSRDNGRTPVLWSEEANGGFSKAAPWIEAAKDDKAYTAAYQQSDPNSVFAHYRKLIRLRKEHPVIAQGDFIPLLEEHPSVIAYKRKKGDSELIVLCNLKGKEAAVNLDEAGSLENYHPILSSYASQQDLSSVMTLRPYESIAFLKDSANTAA